MLVALEKYQEGVARNAPIGRLFCHLFPYVAATSIATIAYAETPAGDRINNGAALNYIVGGTAQSAPSNTDGILVADQLDVALARITSGPVASTDAAMAALLANSGNAVASFRFTAPDTSRWCAAFA